MAHVLGDFLVERVHLLLLGLSCSFGKFTAVKLGVLSGLRLVNSCKWIEEVFIFNGSGIDLLHLVKHNRVLELLGDDRVSLLNDNELLVKEDLGQGFADFEGRIFVIDHAIG